MTSFNFINIFHGFFAAEHPHFKQLYKNAQAHLLKTLFK